MKNYIFSFCCYLFILVLFSNRISAQNNYLSTQYFQKVSQAELFWMEGNMKECYRVLADLDTTCVLLNGTLWGELYSYTELCLMFNNYSRASECIYSLIAGYGYGLYNFKDMKNFRKMKNNSNWKNINNKLLSLERNFFSDTVLYNTIIQMLDDDQYYRNENVKIKNLLKKDSVNSDSLIKLSKMWGDSINRIDSINYQKLLQIINTKGFPLAKTIKYQSRERQKIYTALMVMLIHFSADSGKVSHLEPLLIQFIEQGDCPPELLSNMIDSYQVKNKQPSLYGTYIDLPPEKIYEFEKIDERRKAIGLPNYDLSKQISSKKRGLGVHNTVRQ